jgi:hypothetical protein
MGIGLLALAACGAAGPALAQSSHYPSARNLNDNGSVNDPSPAARNAAAGQPVRGGRLLNYQAPTPQHQYYSSARKADDNGSVDEPGPSH